MSEKDGITYVGLDAHKKAINVAVLLETGQKPIEQWQIANSPKSLKRMVSKVERLTSGADIHCAYEAGPCGYALQRQLESLGANCMVAAPSLIPVKPGDRIKTDKRDADKLSQMLRAGLLTEVIPPTEEEEAVRDLSRARVDAKKDLMSARHRLTKMLLRKGFIYTQGKQWTLRHWEWVRRIRFEQAAAQQVLDNYILAIEQIQERVKQLTACLEEVAESDAYRKQVGWLKCLRGVGTVTAMTILAELHDFRRFTHPRELMSYLGLTPSEHTSMDHVRRGSITKTGNSHVRRILIEAAWHYRHRPSLSQNMKKRREGQPSAVIAIADRAQVRLHRRYFRLKETRKKPHNVIATAIARELVGFIWAILWHQDLPLIAS